jgi:nucleolar pre-ribosomal-associated protein 1
LTIVCFFSRFFFIEFALSFLVVGDPGLLRWILQKRPLYAGVLHGLAKDGEATIIQVLRVFQEKVMATASLVPAGLQSVLFGDVALEQLARIAGDDLFGESADVAYETLMALCTDPSHGLCPEYASPWESANVKAGAYGGNQGRLLRLLLRLRVTEAFRHRELLLTTARIRPRLAAAYLDAVPYSLEPRPSPTW